MPLTRSTTRTRSGAHFPPPKPAHHFRLLDLPTELRLEIYTHALVRGRIHYTPTAFELRESTRFATFSPTSYTPPSLQLLRVCKQIHREAEPIYLFKNTFVLPPMWWLHSPFRKYALTRLHVDAVAELFPPDRPLFSVLGLTYIKSVSIAFCNSAAQTPIPMTRSAWDAQRASPATAHYRFENLRQPQRMQLAHKLSSSRLILHWTRMTRSVAQISAFPTSRSQTPMQMLELDMTNQYCAFGCCKLLYTKMDWLEQLAPKRVRILGTESADERRWIVEVWASKLRIKPGELVGKYGVVFGEEGAEEEWRNGRSLFLR